MTKQTNWAKLVTGVTGRAESGFLRALLLPACSGQPCLRLKEFAFRHAEQGADGIVHALSLRTAGHFWCWEWSHAAFMMLPIPSDVKHVGAI